MTSVVGWTKADYQALHDLKVKASMYNLEVGGKILLDEIPIRAKRQIMSYYVELDEALDDIEREDRGLNHG